MADRTVGALRFCRSPGPTVLAGETGPGQPGAHRRAEQHQPGVRRVGHLQGVPPGRPGPQPGPGGRHGAGRARLDAHRRAVRLDRDQAGRRAHGPGDLVPLPAAASDGWSLAATSVRDLYALAERHGATGLAPRPRPAATSRARRNGSASRPRRSTPTWPRRSAPPSSSREAIRELAEQMFRRLDMAIAAVPELGRYADMIGDAYSSLAKLTEPVPGPAGARRLPPGPGDADPDRLGGARLRGRARQPAGPAPGPLLAAAGRGRDAPLVRLRGPASAASAIPERDSLAPVAGDWVRRNGERVLRGLRRGRRPGPGRATPCCCGPCCWTRRSTRSSTRPGTARTGCSIPLESIADLEGDGGLSELQHPGRHRLHDRDASRAWARSSGSSPASTTTRTRSSAPTPARTASSIRALRPLARSVTLVLDDGRRVPMTAPATRACSRSPCPDEKVPDYRIATSVLPGRTSDETVADDPYRLPAHDRRVRPVPDRGGPARAAVAGARRARPRGRPPVTGTSFAVWAPNARGVRVTGDFNFWDGRAFPMRSLGGVGRVGAVHARRERRRPVQVLDLRAGRGVAGQGRPDGEYSPRRPPATASVVFTSGVRVGRRGLDGRPGRRGSRCASR